MNFLQVPNFNFEPRSSVRWFVVPNLGVIEGLSCVIGLAATLGQATTLGQHCPKLTPRPCRYGDVIEKMLPFSRVAIAYPQKLLDGSQLAKKLPKSCLTPCHANVMQFSLWDNLAE